MEIIRNAINSLFKRQEHALNRQSVKTLRLSDAKQIEYCRFGKGNPLVLVMGYAATLSGWDIRFLAKLAQSFEVIVYNHRNIGNSIFALKEHSIADLAHDLELLRSGLQLGKITLAGLSMGGMVAQEYAYLYPEQLCHLILMNTLPAGTLMQRPSVMVENTLRNLTISTFGNNLRLLKLLLPSLWHLPQVALNLFKPVGSKQLVYSSTILEQQKALEGWSSRPQSELILARIKIPTLILVGQSDRLIPPLNSHIIAQSLTNAQLIAYKSGGHIMLFQYPHQLAQDILHFLR